MRSPKAINQSFSSPNAKGSPDSSSLFVEANQLSPHNISVEIHELVNRTMVGLHAYWNVATLPRSSSVSLSLLDLSLTAHDNLTLKDDLSFSSRQASDMAVIYEVAWYDNMLFLTFEYRGVLYGLYSLRIWCIWVIDLYLSPLKNFSWHFCACRPMLRKLWNDSIRQRKRSRLGKWAWVQHNQRLNP